jgi:hypothetical protein
MYGGPSGYAPAPVPAYIEGPEDVGVLPSAATPAAPGAGEAAVGEGDIDTLMKELDRISSEILKKGPPKKDGESPSPDDVNPAGEES